MSTFVINPMLGRAVVQVAMAMALQGCASTHSGEVPSRPSETAADFYTLLPGWGWAYDLERDGTRVLAVYSVIERSGMRALVRNGDEAIAYAVLPEGIARANDGVPGDFLLKNPVRAGQTWPLRDGQAVVTSAGAAAISPAGSYRDCATVEEQRHLPERAVVTTYCKDVGPVDIEVRIDGAIVAKARLRAVTRPDGS